MTKRIISEELSRLAKGGKKQGLVAINGHSFFFLISLVAILYLFGANQVVLIFGIRFA